MGSAGKRVGLGTATSILSLGNFVTVRLVVSSFVSFCIILNWPRIDPASILRQQDQLFLQRQFLQCWEREFVFRLHFVLPEAIS